jgi:hypothetical protein
MQTIAVATLLSVLIGAGFATGAVASEPVTTPLLVELFTAEGCSSCPPADAFLVSLDEHQPIPGGQIIVLSEHMDYWNSSWPDPFASGQLTARQSGYVRALRDSSAFTPQFVIDGSIEMRLRDKEEIARNFQTALAAPKIPVSITALKVAPGTPDTVSGQIDVDGSAAAHKADVYIALAIDRIETKVLRGENRGKDLTHVGVVEYLSKVGELKPGEKFSQNFNVPFKRGMDPNNARVIVFVQEPGYGRVVGAALHRTALPG